MARPASQPDRRAQGHIHWLRTDKKKTETETHRPDGRRCGQSGAGRSPHGCHQQHPVGGGGQAGGPLAAAVKRNAWPGDPAWRELAVQRRRRSGHMSHRPHAGLGQALGPAFVGCGGIVQHHPLHAGGRADFGHRAAGDGGHHPRPQQAVQRREHRTHPQQMQPAAATTRTPPAPLTKRPSRSRPFWPGNVSGQKNQNQNSLLFNTEMR